MSGPPESAALQPHAALLSLGRTLLGTVRTHADLLALELTQEQHRLAQLALYGGLALLSLALCLELLVVGVVAWSWDTAYRWPAVVGITLLFAAGAGACGLVAARRLRAAPRPFEATLAALADDLRSAA